MKITITTILLILNCLFVFSQKDSWEKIDYKTVEHRSYWKNGDLKMYELVKNRRNQGAYCEYHENGELKCIGTYLNNEKTKQWIFKYPTGTIEKIGTYSKGKKNNDWKYFDEKGRIITENNTPIIPSAADSIEAFVPTGWKKIYQLEEDLNLDSYKDYLLLIENTSKSNEIENSSWGEDLLNVNPRYLLIILYDHNTNLRLHTLNKEFIHSEHDSLSICLADPFKEGGEITASPGALNITFSYWLSCGSWSSTRKTYGFQYLNEEFYLTYIGSHSFARNSGNEQGYLIDFLNQSEAHTEGGNFFEDSLSNPITKRKSIIVDSLYNLKFIKNTDF